jgi:uncharacterized protein YggU (UPF0235/DUF167 family)
MYIKVTVFPGFKKELVEKTGEDSFKMYLKQPAERGLANKRVLEIVQEMFPGKRVRIVNGALTPKKLICLTTPGGRG